jgi:hypothetical protein
MSWLGRSLPGSLLVQIEGDPSKLRHVAETAGWGDRYMSGLGSQKLIAQARVVASGRCFGTPACIQQLSEK